MTVYLEQYLDSLETLPADMRRNFKMMRDLDQQSQESLSTIDSTVQGYVANCRDLTPDERNSRLSSVEEHFLKAKNAADEKVLLSQETYNLVDSHIQRLDSDLARFEGELKETISGDRKRKKTQGNRKAKKILAPPKKGRRLTQEELEDEVPRIGKKKGKISANNPFIQQGTSNTSLINLSTSHPASPTSGASLYDKLASVASDVLDMPVDPNEPTYCNCQQVSYGEMIGCDEPDCPIEWFHFGCVGLSSKPKGKWYCSDCLERRHKKG